MSLLPICLGMSAPLYNLAMVFVIVILFITLFRTRSETIYNKPWYFLFAAVMTFIVEEVVTVAESMGLLPQVSQFVFIFFEILIISFFIYTLLLQKEYLQNRGL